MHHPEVLLIEIVGYVHGGYVLVVTRRLALSGIEITHDVLDAVLCANEA